MRSAAFRYFFVALVVLLLLATLTSCTNKRFCDVCGKDITKNSYAYGDSSLCDACYEEIHSIAGDANE